MNRKTLPFSSFTLIVAFVCLSLVGLAVIPLLPVKLNPSRSLPGFTLSFSMPGASSRVVEMEVTSRLEAMLSRIVGVENISSTSGNGYDGTIQADSGAAAVLTETGGKNNGAALELTRGSNGAGGYVELPVAALTAIPGDWSMNLWVKLTDNPTWNHIFSMGTDKNRYALLATATALDMQYEEERNKDE